MRQYLIGAAALALLAPASAFATQIFTFDDSNVPAGSYLYPSTGLIPGTGEAFYQNSVIQANSAAWGFSNDGTAATAVLQSATQGEQGSFILTLSGLVSGKTYAVNFIDESRPYNNGGTAYTATYGSQVANFSAPGSTTSFTPESFTFVADSQDTTLTFAAALATGGFDRATAIDTVAVSLAPVPEPATWALMLVGFGGLGAALRGRRRFAAASI